MFKKSSILRVKIIGITLFVGVRIAAAQGNAGQIAVSYTKMPGAFPLSSPGIGVKLITDKADAEVLHIAAKCFSEDLQRVTGKPVDASAETIGASQYVIIAGTLGKSKLTDELAEKNPTIKAISGKWETFHIAIINNPYKGVKQALVVAGSDRRGTAFGLFELSRMIGVQPFYWWADIKPAHHGSLYLTAGKPIQQSPSVQYRGIFLNDEDFGLQPWAANNMDKDVKDIGPKTYARIFELLLRLKANYIWPAMHSCTKAFWYYKQNPIVAEKYAIVLGASHCEPMLRNNVFEWTENYENEYKTGPGHWRYDENKNQIFTYWNDRVKESKGNDAVYTVGMRGIHDGSMPGPPSIEAKTKLLEEVIADQRSMLKNVLPTTDHTAPQIFCPYKEVLDIYQAGLNLPDDITIAWADDNHGYIRQLSSPDEQKRSGKSGIYYHLSYWGSPEDYLWLSSVSPALISHEMSKAYQFGANKLWVFNVGDIKPAELETQFAMDLAWNVNQWPPQKAQQYLKKWASETFGQQFAGAISRIKAEYYRLAASAKPEHLHKIKFTTTEADQRLKDYEAIALQAAAIKKRIPANLQNAYFELIYYPVTGAYLMNKKFLCARKSIALANTGNTQALYYGQIAKDAYKQIQNITVTYNKMIAGGKWNGMMDWQPRKQDAFIMPEVATKAMLKTAVAKPAASTMPKANVQLDITKSYIIKNTDSTKITIVPGLGINGNGLTVLPYAIKQYAVSDIQQAPYVEYKIKLDAGKHNIWIKCLPTFRIYKGLNLRYAISVNNSDPQIINIGTDADTPVWAENVLRGYAQGMSTHQIIKDTESTIRIYMPDAGLVINQIEVN
ncbi:glycosyl hydrolase 115 family protein [Mucilaginibacter terrae]|uniref:glycosyl hydrolase 115 family protein n=1 Tax=Mucilaginibacter terrae TaxID=1955052 RepID=UPI003634E851